ncbi:MAG: L-histidine N(alpha)-methyltransferase [Myxococcota bacterium]
MLRPRATQSADDFATAVRLGLDGARKSLPCRFLYDARGSDLFEQICELPEYYPTRAERSILADRSDEIVARAGTPLSLVELGSGSAEKTRLLIEALIRRQGDTVFAPIDVSRSALEQSAQGLLEDHDELRIVAVEAEYAVGLRELDGATHSRRLILWLGSSIGNLDRDAAARFLRELRGEMERGEKLLVGIDLRKESDRLERAYDDARGVTARFNLNLLTRINRELGGDFDRGSFRHVAEYSEREGRVEISLESRCSQVVRIEKLDREIEFGEGERIHTEDSFKYSFQEIDALAESSGLRSEARWLDDAGDFSLNLFDVA